MTLEAVVFDVGETLVDETRAWSLRAEEVGVTALTLFGALGALIARGEDHRRVWDLLGVEKPVRDVPIDERDLYPDVVPCLRALRTSGLRVGLAGNQPASAATSLRSLGLPVDAVATSEAWGVEKPSADFFLRVCAELKAPAAHIVYVGDRLDNDVLPAKAAGMFAVFIRRGPWGHLHAHLPEMAFADARIDGLAELPAALSEIEGA